MPELAKALPRREKTRVQIDLSSTELERMNWMMETCGIESRKDLFNNALTLLEWTVAEVVEGRKIASFDDDKKDRTVLTMPILRNAEKMQNTYEREPMVEFG